MGIKHLWDTNTAIYYLQQRFPLEGEIFIDSLLKNEQPVISAITEIELLCWKTAIEKDLIILHNFIKDALILELEHPIKLQTADIRKKHNIKLPDAIIAATGLVYDLTQITRNIGDFQNISGLNIIDPWNL